MCAGAAYCPALREEATVRLNPPTKIVFYLSLVFAAVGLIANFVNIPVLSGIAFYLVLIGYVLLFLGNTLKGF
jgi:Co/Zn/Cd efflux system component